MLNTHPFPMPAPHPAPLPANIENQASLYGGTVTIQLGAFGRRRHAYRWIEQDMFVPGTTSITGILDKPALLPWTAKQVAAYVEKELKARVIREGKRSLIEINKADIEALAFDAKGAPRRFVDDASEVGKQVHDYANRMFKGEYIGDLPDSVDLRVRNGVNAIRDWVRNNDVTPLGAEQIVFSRKWYYAGTYDLLATVNGRLAIIDFKTSKDIYREHRLQTAAYQIAWEEEHGELIFDRWAIRVDKYTGQFEAHPLPRSQLEMDTFLRLKEVDENLKKMEQAA